MSEPTRKPRVSLDKRGRVIIVGLNYRDALSLMDMAFIHLSESEATHRPEWAKTLEAAETAQPHYMKRVIQRNVSEDKRWYRHMRWIIDTLSQQINQRVTDSNPVRPLTIEDRQYQVEQKRKLRLSVKKALKERGFG